MVPQVFKSFVIITTMSITCEAFWWQPTTTEMPLIKEIPLTYFRTYTYHQPLSGIPPYAFTFMNGATGARSEYQMPLLIGNRRYDISPPADDLKVQLPTWQTAAPIAHTSKVTQTTPSTTTSTTTTTTPAPETTTTTSTTTTAAPSKTTSTTAVPSLQPQIEPLINYNGVAASSVPNRRFATASSSGQNNNYRLNYPYPEYSNYNFPSPAQSAASQVQFVPCMCPVSVVVPAEGTVNGYPENRSSESEIELRFDSAIPNNGINENVASSTVAVDEAKNSIFKQDNETTNKTSESSDIAESVETL